MNVAFKDACNIWLYDNLGEPVLFTDYANSTSIEFSSSVSYAQAKGVNKISFESDKQGSFSADFDIYDMKWLSILLGAVEDTAVHEVAVREVLTVSSNVVTTTETPKAGSVVVFEVDTDEKTHISDAIDPDSVTGNTVTLTTASLADGTKVAVYFLKDTASNTRFTIKSDQFAEFYSMRGQAMMTKEDGNIDPIEFFFPNVRPQSSFTFNLDASEPSSLTVNFDILPNTSNIMMEIIYI